MSIPEIQEHLRRVYGTETPLQFDPDNLFDTCFTDVSDEKLVDLLDECFGMDDDMLDSELEEEDTMHPELQPTVANHYSTGLELQDIRSDPELDGEPLLTAKSSKTVRMIVLSHSECAHPRI